MTKREQVIAKVEWAEQHIFDLEDRIASINRDCVVRFNDDPKSGDRIYKLVEVGEIPLWVSLMVGDIINNLRCSLDHLAHHLVSVNKRSPGPFRSVYFPIFSSPDEYESGKRGKIGSAGDAAMRIIDKIEPYCRGNGHNLWLLNKLAISDKHRLTLAARLCNPYHSMPLSKARKSLRNFLGRNSSTMTNKELAIMFQTEPSVQKFPLECGDILAVIGKDDINEHMQFTFDVAFYQTEVLNREPIMPALRALHSSVEFVMVTFANEGFFA